MAAVVPLGLAISTSWWASLVTFIIAGAAAEGAIVTGSSPAWQKHFQRGTKFDMCSSAPC